MMKYPAVLLHYESFSLACSGSQWLDNGKIVPLSNFIS